MEAIQAGFRIKSADENIRQHLRDVMERHKLPSLPVVVTKVLNMVNDPDFSVRELARVISDDTALAARILAVSRSPRYIQRKQPATVYEAILVLGFRAVRNVVMAMAAQSFLTRTNKTAERLWSHSLAAALAARILSRRSGFEDQEFAFLAGLLHDVGEMILLRGDPKGFEKLLYEIEQTKGSLAGKETETYGFDHALIGVALLESWSIDARICDAVLRHHEGEESPDPRSLVTILRVADFLCSKADLAFFSEPSALLPHVSRAFGCEEDESLAALVQEVRQAFDEENRLFKTA